MLNDVVRRAVFLSAGAGIAVGGILGTAEFPVVGTFFGATAGGAYGAGLGLMTGLLLTMLPRLSQGWLRLLPAAVVASAIALMHGWPLAGAPNRIALTVVSATLAALLAPSIVNGWRPLDLGPRLRGIQVTTFVNRLVTAGAATGAVVGALAGLIIGLRTYLPTAAVATVEGTVLGAASGIVLAVIVAATVVCLRVRPLPG